MSAKKIEVVKRDGRFTVRLLRAGREPQILLSDKDGAPLKHDWWLEEYRTMLAERGCPTSQITDTMATLTSKDDVELSFDLPD